MPEDDVDPALHCLLRLAELRTQVEKAIGALKLGYPKMALRHLQDAVAE